MEITEVRIKLVERSSERLRAFCSITLDGDFVIRDLKIIDGINGAFVAMPSRKLADRCPRCGCKNHLRAKFCNECGNKLNENRAPKDAQGRAKLHADVAHPINAACRERIQHAVIEAFQAELERAKSPDYKPPKYDDFEDDVEEAIADEGSSTTQVAPPAPVRHSGSLPSTASTTPAPKPAPRPVPKAAEEEGDDVGDYNSLIAELKRDAADRRERQDEHRGSWGSTPAGEGSLPSTASTTQRRGPVGTNQPANRDHREQPEQFEGASSARPPRDQDADAEPVRPAPGKPADQGSSTTQPHRTPPPPPPAPKPFTPPPPPVPAKRQEQDDDFAAGL